MFAGKENIAKSNAGFNNRHSAFFQPKLSVNQPNDVYEQEADAMTDKVMRMADTEHTKQPFFKPTLLPVQRKCKNCGEEEKLQRKENSESKVQGSNELDNYVGTLSSSGPGLPRNVRQFFEPRFDNDFSNVRIHTDSAAAKSAQSINALAYTTGNNIVFNSGQYSPDSENGKRLMAHELTHVVQQGSDVAAKISKVANDTVQLEPASNTPAPAPGVNIPSPPPPPLEQIAINTANYQRLANLVFARQALDAVNMALNDPSYDKSKLSTDFAPAISALNHWVKIKPSDTDFKNNLSTVMSLIKKNADLGRNPPAFYQKPTGPPDAKGGIMCATPAYAWSYVGDSSTGVSCCDDFVKSGPLCKTDVLTHEHFHLIGLGHGDRGGKGTTRAERTTAECLDSSDNMAQLVSELNGVTTDNCPSK